MAQLANTGTSLGTYTYSGIKMEFSMWVNAISKSGSSNAYVEYTLKSRRVSGSSHPYASIQAKLNDSQVYNSGYNAYDEWPGSATGGTTKDLDATIGGWGSNITFQVTGHVGSPSGNTLTGNTVTIRWNTVSYNTSQGTAPASVGQYTGNSITIAGAPTNLSSAYRFLGWNTQSDGKGTRYTAGQSLSLTGSNIILYAELELLKPTMNVPTLNTPTEDSIPYGALSANISGCTYEYTINNGANWYTASASGGSITGLGQNTAYTVKFRAIYSGNVSDVVTAGTKTTYKWPYITNLSGNSNDAGNAVTITLYNPLSRNVTITPSIGGTNVGSSTSTKTTSASITLTNSNIIGTFAGSTDKTLKTKSVRYTSSYSGHTSYLDRNINLTSATGPTVNSSKINSFITYTVSDNKEDTSHLVRGKSSVKITLSDTAANNAFVASTGTEIDPNSYYYRINGGDPVQISLGTPSTGISVPSSGNTFTITITCADKRGFSNTQTCSRSLSTTAVTNPVISLENIKREGNARTQISFTSTGTWNSVITSIGKYGQGARLILEYKLNTNPNWATQTGVANSYGSWEVYGSSITTNMELNNTDKLANGFGSVFAVDQGYDFRLKVKNKYESTYLVSNIASIPRSEPIMFIDSGVNGVGINCFPRGEGLWLKRGINTISLDRKILDLIYPVGSIFMTTNQDFNTKEKVASHFGGTWAAWGTGKVPVGIDTSDDDFKTVEQIGGSKTSVAAHTHGFSGTTENQSADHTHNIDSHTHTMAHTHNIGGKGITTTATTKTLTGQWRSTKARFPGGSSQDSNGIFKEWEEKQATYWNNTGGTDTNTVGWKIDARHEHTGKINDGTSTDDSSAANTGGTSLTTKNQNTNHNHKFSGTTNSTGKGNGNLQPYIVCYMWKRIA